MLKQTAAFISILMMATFGFATEAPPAENVVLPAKPGSAAEPIPAVQQVQEVLPDLGPREGKNYLASFSYSLVDIPLPNKMGLNLGLIKSPTQTWELEFLRGNLSFGGFRDLASASDTRIGLIGRSYYGKHFHISYGLSYFDFSAKLGDELMNGMTGGAYPSVDVLTIQGFGANVGLGTTWVFKQKFTLGIDWISWAQPLFITKRSSDYLNYSNNQSGKDNVSATIRFVSYLPRFSVLGVHLGMLF